MLKRKTMYDRSWRLGVFLSARIRWEAGVAARVGEHRAGELAALRGSARLRSFNYALAAASPVVVALLTFGTFTLAGGDLTAEVAFTALALLNAAGHPVKARYGRSRPLSSLLKR